MAESEYLVVDLPAQGLVLARHTTEVPGSQVDSIREGPPSSGSGYVSSHLVLLQGFQQDQFDAVLSDMRRTYPDIQVVEMQPLARRWLLRNRVRADHVQAKQLLMLGKTEAEFGLYWTHIQEGRFQLRAEVRSKAGALRDVARLQALYEKAGVPAVVRLATLSGGDLAVSRLLRELLDRFPA